MARIYDRFMRDSEREYLRAWRAKLLGQLTASRDVLEVGAGTGANLEYYPEAVERLVLSEPDRHMRARLQTRCAQHGHRDIEVSASSVERLPFSSEQFDAVVCTLVLCSVRDLNRGLTEIRRVLKPGGQLLFIEHIAAEARTPRLQLQRSIEPFWRRISGNCHLTRRSDEALERMGFGIERLERHSPEQLSVVGPKIAGVARKYQ